MSNISSLDKNSVNKAKYSNFTTILANIRVEFDQAKMKLLIVLIILVFSGLTSVVSQKYLNQILELSGITLANPITPTMTTFLNDFLGNSLIYIIIIIIFGGGTFSNEVEVNKQVYFLLSRPITRSNYFFTRSLILTIGMAIATIIGSFIVYFYALVYFSALPIDKIFLIFLLSSFQYASMYAFMIMFCAKYNQVTSWVFGILTYLSESIIAFLASFYDPLKWLSPFYLANDYLHILDGSLTLLDLSEYFVVLIIVWTAFPILIGWFWYRRRDL